MMDYQRLIVAAKFTEAWLETFDPEPVTAAQLLNLAECPFRVLGVTTTTARRLGRALDVMAKSRRMGLALPWGDLLFVERVEGTPARWRLA